MADLFAGEIGVAEFARRQSREAPLLLRRGGGLYATLDGLAQIARDRPIAFGRVASRAQRDLGRQQRRHDAILVRCPDGAVETQKRRARAFFAGETERSVAKTIDVPFESYRHFVHGAAKPCRHAIDHLRADDRPADRGSLAPPGPVRKEIVDHDRQIVIRRQQPGASGDDSVAIVVGVAGERDVEAVFRRDQRLHRVRRRRVHPHTSIPIERHEPERGVDDRIDDVEVQSIAFGNRRPVMDARASHRIRADMELRAAQHVHVDDARQVADVVVQEIVPVRRRGTPCLVERNALHPFQRPREKVIRPLLDPGRHLLVRRAAAGRVVLEPAAFRRVMRRRDDDAVREARGAAAVPGQDGVRHGGRRRVFVVARKHDLDAIGGQHLQRAGLRGHGERVRVDTEEQRAVDAPALAVMANGLGDRENVRFVEALVERGPAMSGRAECHCLPGYGGIGRFGVVRGDEPRHVDQQFRRHRLPGERIRRHDCASAPLFAAMQSSRSRHALSNVRAPSTWSRSANVASSTPARRNSSITCSASPPSAANTPFTSP